MPKPASKPASSSSAARKSVTEKSVADWLDELARPARIAALAPSAARFIYSLRLIALHDRARRDPVPELTARLGSMEVAAKSLALAQTIAIVWPEDIHVSRFCCDCLTHDEATLGALIEGCFARDQEDFHAHVTGLLRPERVTLLWEAVLDLVAAEMQST